MSTLIEMYQNRINENIKLSKSLSLSEMIIQTQIWLKQIEMSLLTDSRWESTINDIIEKIKNMQSSYFYSDDYYTILNYTKDDHMSNDKLVPFNLNLSYNNYITYGNEDISLNPRSPQDIENYTGIKINAPGHILDGCRLGIHISQNISIRLYYTPLSSFCTLI